MPKKTTPPLKLRTYRSDDALEKYLRLASIVTGISKTDMIRVGAKKEAKKLMEESRGQR